MTKRLSVLPTPIAGVQLVERSSLGDARGFLQRLFCVNELADTAFGTEIRQVNTTFTAHPGTVRGLHFQRWPATESKLVSCLAGRVYDVAVDLRKESDTYLKWFATELSDENRMAMLIPQGVAHGLQTLEPNTQMLYCHSADYNADLEDGINVADPALGIQWPLPVSEISKRDQALPMTRDAAFRGPV